MVTRKSSAKPVKATTKRQYGKTNLDKAKERLNRYRESQTQFWTPKKGSNTIRILPPWKEDGDEFWREAAIHWGVGSDEKVFFCPLKTAGEPCILCERAEELLASSDEEEVEMGRNLRANTAVFYNIIDRKDPERGVQVFRSGVQIFGQILDYVADPEYGDITDPEEGFDVVIEKTGERRNTKYNVRLKRNPSALDDLSVLDQLKDLDALVQLRTEDEMREALEETGADDEEDDDDDEIGESLTGEDDDEDEEDAPKKDAGKDDDEEQPDCFGDEYDQYVECEDCDSEEQCEAEYKKKQKGKSKPQRTKKK